MTYLGFFLVVIAVLTEFRNQLMEIEEVISHIPPLIIQEVVQGHISEARSQHTQLQDKLSLTLQGLHDTQVSARVHCYCPDNCSPFTDTCEYELNAAQFGWII